MGTQTWIQEFLFNSTREAEGIGLSVLYKMKPMYWSLQLQNKGPGVRMGHPSS